MNNKFKVGDKVRCIELYCESKFLTKNKIYEVLSISPEHIGIVSDNGSKHDFFSSRFELVERADDLDELIEQANALFPKLHARRAEIEIKNSYDFDWCDLFVVFNGAQLRRKAPALPAPFTLKNSGHKVTFQFRLNKQPDVSVGCQTFCIDEIKPALTNLLKNGMSMSYEFYATREGVAHTAGKITWADAEQLLAALEGLAALEKVKS